MGLFGGGGTKERPSTSSFNVGGQILGGRFSSADEGTPSLNLGAGTALRPFVRTATELGRRGQIDRPATVERGLSRLLGVGADAFQRAETLQRSADSITPDAEFNAIQRLLAPQEARQRSALESRLFAQGRLGTTGGTQQQQAQETSFGENRLTAAVRAITGAREAQGQARGQANQALQTALALTQAGTSGLEGIRRQDVAEQVQGLQNLLGINSAQLQALQTAGALSGVQQVQRTGGGLGGTLAKLGGSAIGSFGGPLGSAAGSALAGNLFGEDTTATTRGS